MMRWYNRLKARLQSIDSLDNENYYLKESLTQLQLEIENLGYERMAATTDDFNFPRHRLKDLVRISRALAIKNPISNRTVNVKADYIFGRGVKFITKHPLVRQVVDEHTKYHSNQQVLYSHSAQTRQSRELAITGNLFIACFMNPRTGRVLVRTIDMEEVADIIRDPLDYHTEWFVRRSWDDGSGVMQNTYYPCWNITRASGASLPRSAPKGNIDWDTPVYHVAWNRHGTMKFAIPETYPQHDYVVSYKGFVENWLSLMKSYARMAFKMTGIKNRKQAAAARSQMQTAITLTRPLETNPSPVQASTALLKDKADIEPVKTAGATTNADAAQPVLNLCAAGGGMNSSFYGDKAGSGSTNESLDRPTELAMKSQQKLWAEVYTAIIGYAVKCAGIAPFGILTEAGATKNVEADPFTDEPVVTVTLPVNNDEQYGEVGQPIDATVSVSFPELLERNVTDRVRALCNAFTMFGKPLTDIVPDKRLVCRLLIESLNLDLDVDAVMPSFLEMWTANMSVDDGKPAKPYIIPPAVPDPKLGAEDPSQGGDVGANG